MTVLSGCSGPALGAYPAERWAADQTNRSAVTEDD